MKRQPLRVPSKQDTRSKKRRNVSSPPSSPSLFSESLLRSFNVPGLPFYHRLKTSDTSGCSSFHASTLFPLFMSMILSSSSYVFCYRCHIVFACRFLHHHNPLSVPTVLPTPLWNERYRLSPPVLEPKNTIVWLGVMPRLRVSLHQQGPLSKLGHNAAVASVTNTALDPLPRSHGP
jgi:hypothetical protein